MLFVLTSLLLACLSSVSSYTYWIDPNSCGPHAARLVLGFKEALKWVEMASMRMYRNEPVQKQHFHRLFAPADHPRYEEFVEHVKRTGDPVP